MKTIRTIATAAVVAAGSLLLPTAAHAGVTSATITSDPSTSRRHMASFDGTANYDSTTHKLTVTLHNTTNKGFLTGFAFNAMSPMSAKYQDGDVVGTKMDEDGFDNIKKRPKPSKNIKPWGHYIGGATLDGRWNSQKASRGVNAGMSQTFTFNIAGADDDCTIADIFNENPLTLIAKFRGLKGHKQDQVGARIQVTSSSIVTPPINLVPSDPTPTGPTGPTEVIKPIIDPVDTGGGGTHAVPLPPAAVPALITIALTGVFGLRKRLFGAVA